MKHWSATGNSNGSGRELFERIVREDREREERARQQREQRECYVVRVVE
jgi:hypothetical protein